MPGEYGQVGSYVIGVKMVLPSGDLLEVTEIGNPELMQKVRSSYGLFGIIYEVTFRIRPLVPMAVHHGTFTMKEFCGAPGTAEAQLLDVLLHVPVHRPNHRRVPEVQPRRHGQPNARVEIRNHFWGTAGPRFGNETEQHIHPATLRYTIIEALQCDVAFQAGEHHQR